LKLTNKNLKQMFNHANRKYFNNELPNIPITWKKKLMMNGAVGECVFNRDDEKHPNKITSVEIHLHTWLQDYPPYLIQTLLHEMAHLKLGVRVHHGKVFQKEIRRLVAVGAYDGIL